MSTGEGVLSRRLLIFLKGIITSKQDASFFQELVLGSEDFSCFAFVPADSWGNSEGSLPATLAGELVSEELKETTGNGTQRRKATG